MKTLATLGLLVMICSCNKTHTWICEYETKDGRTGIDTSYGVTRAQIKETAKLFNKFDCKKTNHNKW